MEKIVKPENIYIGRRRLVNVISALVFLALGIFLALLIPLGFVESEDKAGLILISVCSGILFAVCVTFIVLNIRNLFFPYILTADEKGIHNCSGLLHFGLIEWKDIEALKKDVNLFEADGNRFCLRIFVKDIKQFKSKLSFFRKAMFFFENKRVKIYTLDSKIGKKQIYTLLDNMLTYYNAPDKTVNINE